MAGGLMQLVAYGAQDVYLTGNPQITFFKVVYRRHTNFSIEAIEQTGSGSLGLGRKMTFPITRNGDLVTKMYLKATVNGGDALSGHRLIRSVELQIGGSKIDKHYGLWLTIWNELSRNSSLDRGYTAMVEGTNLNIPLQFFCCRNDGLALPLIALQYHDVRVDIEFAATVPAVGGAGAALTNITSATLLVDYIYLDSEERRRFAQASHEYLIEQLQYTGAETAAASTNNRYRLNFNHPVKELVWVAETGGANTHVFANDTTSGPVSGTSGGVRGTGAGGLTVTNAQLKLNGHDRFSEQPGAYFNYVQPHQHHSNTPADGINVYSFALNPEEHQPSGTCNMSRIDNAELNVAWGTLNGAGPAANRTAHIFATNYNVLRIMSGMGGLAYSN